MILRLILGSPNAPLGRIRAQQTSVPHRRLRASLRVLLCAAVLLGGQLRAAEVQVETVAEGLALPWSLAFLPDGDFLVTERRGRLLRIGANGAIEAEITGVPEVLFAGQGGLMDIALDPAFATNGRVYLSYAHGDTGANATRIHAARLVDDALLEGETLFEVRPLKTTPQHYGARMAFMPDGTLLMTTGDGFDHREDAQRRSSLLGKIVRLHTDGSIPTDNPFFGDPDARSEIWSLGHRNPQGLVVSADGSVWEHEHGPRGGDEVNRIEPGANYGWPVATHGLDYIGARISPFESYPGMVEPEHFWTPSIAPSGMTRYSGAAFGAWDGDLLLGGLAIVGLYRVDIEGGHAGISERIVPTIDERIRDVRTGPDGLIYVLTDADPGRLLRLRPMP